MKMAAPENISHFEFDNVKYERDEDGTFDIKHPAHVKAATMHGARPYDPELGAVVLPVVERVQSDFDQQMADKDDEIAALKRQLAEAQAAKTATETPATPGATDTPATPASASGDTSSGQGGTASDQQEDRLGAALALNPDFDTMGRDDMVEWLKGVGISAPSNLSTEKTRSILNDAVAAYKAEQEQKA